MSIRFDEKGKFFSTVVEKVPVPVVIQTRLDRIEGNFYMRPEERLKDTLNQEGMYIGLTDAFVLNAMGEKLYDSDFLLVNREHILWVLPKN